MVIMGCPFIVVRGCVRGSVRARSASSLNIAAARVSASPLNFFARLITACGSWAASVNWRMIPLIMKVVADCTFLCDVWSIAVTSSYTTRDSGWSVASKCGGGGWRWTGTGWGGLRTLSGGVLPRLRTVLSGSIVFLRLEIVSSERHAQDTTQQGLLSVLFCT